MTNPQVIAVLNITPDSFYDGGRYVTETAILQRVETMLSEGADIIDIGGYSTRPGADEISSHEERARVTGAVNAIAREFPSSVICIDTFRSEVAEAAVDAGAAMVNDVAGGTLDEAMFTTIARLKVPYVMMHMRGTPQTMQTLTQYENPVTDIIHYFHEKLYQLRQLGVKDVIIDPGFGFAKTAAQSFYLLQQLDKFAILGRPMLVGVSRKSMIWKTLETDPGSALNGTTVLNTVALMKGASMLRVHDVREAREAIKLFISLQVNVTA